MIGMIQLRGLAGGSRYAGEPLASVLGHALDQAALLQAAGFTMLMVQNLGDLPVAQSAAPAQVAWMTRVARELRFATHLPLGLNLLENDVEAMLAIASAADCDFVRVKVFVGAMVTPSGVEPGRAFATIRARNDLRAGAVAILADVHDRTGTPIATSGLVDDVHTAFAIGGADGVVLTGRSHAETVAMLSDVRARFPTRPLIVGGGVSADNVAEIVRLADGAIVSSALKRDNDLFGELDAAKAHAFVTAAAAAR